MSTVAAGTCPQCGGGVAADAGFSPWCERCGWNVSAGRSRPTASRLQRINESLGRRYAGSLFGELQRRAPDKPRFGVATAGAIALSLAVYAAVALLAMGGAYLVSRLMYPNANLFVVAFGLFLLVLAWLVRPRWPTLKDIGADDRPVYARSELPELYGLVDRVARSTGGATVTGIVIEPEFNAGYVRIGIRRRPLLVLGLPLFMALDPQERVALLGHELGHGVNGDPGRGFVVAGALRALVTVHTLLEPDELLPADEGIVAFAALPFRLVLLLASRAFYVFAIALLLLLFRDSQRAEYYADGIAARLAGRDATASMLELLHSGPAVSMMTWLGGTRDPIADIAAKARAIPPRELERMRRAEEIAGSALDATHPPTAYRVQIVRSRLPAPATFVLGARASERIDRELQLLREAIGAEIVDRHLGTL
jgi:Zn-dependent protease with chaperone function